MITVQKLSAFSARLSAKNLLSIWRLRRTGSHPIFSEVLRIHFLQPLPEPLRIVLLPFRSERPALFEYLLLDEDVCLRSESQGDRIAGPAVDVPGGFAPRKVDPGEERVVPQIVDDDPIDLRLELRENVLQEVVGHRPGSRDALHLDGDRIGFEDAHPDG